MGGNLTRRSNDPDTRPPYATDGSVQFKFTMNSSEDDDTIAISPLDIERVQSMEVDQSHHSECGNWSVHRYAKDYIVLVSRKDCPPATDGLKNPKQVLAFVQGLANRTKKTD